MRAATWDSSGRLVLSELASPSRAEGEILVRPSLVGICGSDLHFFRREFEAAPGGIPGHEIAGYVVEGEGFAAGTAVAVDPMLPCGRCPSCRRGQTPACRRLRLMGISSPGGMQDFLAAPLQNVYALPDGVDTAIGSMAEPLAVCVRALNRAEAPFGSRVLILGAGTIGLIAAMLAAETAAEVAITARYPHQAALAKSFGTNRVFAPGSADLFDWARSNPVDLVIETVGGSADTLAEAINAVGGGGTVVPLGVFTTDVLVPARKLVNQEVKVVGSVVYGHAGSQSEFGAAVGLLPRYAERLALLRTATYPLERANEAFEHALNKSRNAVKISVSVTS